MPHQRVLAAGLFAALSVAVALPVSAADDPIATRKAMMDDVKTAIGEAVKMAKGETEYDPRVAKLAFTTFNAVALGYGELFPEGTETGGKTEAAPKIWEDKPGFIAAVAKFRDDSAAAAKAPAADLDAFRVQFGKVAENCKACHETYRISKD